MELYIKLELNNNKKIFVKLRIYIEIREGYKKYFSESNMHLNGTSLKIKVSKY